MTASGHITWAEAYLSAAEALYLSKEDSYDLHYFAGPILNLVGLATELTLKCLIRGAGIDDKKLKSLGHNTYNLYCQAREYFDEVKFIQLVLSNTEHLKIPNEVDGRISSDAGSMPPSVRWRIYFDQLRILDETYDRPYRNRYVTPGSVVLPEPYIILAGTKILAKAIRERVA